MTPWPLYPRERTPVPTEQQAGEAPEPAWTLEKPKNLLPLSGLEPRTVCTDYAIEYTS